jgi:hypothetical protein
MSPGKVMTNASMTERAQRGFAARREGGAGRPRAAASGASA